MKKTFIKVSNGYIPVDLDVVEKIEIFDNKLRLSMLPDRFKVDENGGCTSAIDISYKNENVLKKTKERLENLKNEEKKLINELFLHSDDYEKLRNIAKARNIEISDLLEIIVLKYIENYGIK